MTDHVTDDVRAFFREFERASNEGDPDAIAAQFAEVFLNADPNGTQPVPRSAFIAALPHRQSLFDRAGLRGTRLLDLDATPLDDHHVLVATRWATDLANPDRFDGPLELASTFILRREPDGLKIVFYLNHQDILARVRAAAP